MTVEIFQAWLVYFGKAALFGFIAGIAVGAISGFVRDAIS